MAGATGIIQLGFNLELLRARLALDLELLRASHSGKKVDAKQKRKPLIRRITHPAPGGQQALGRARFF
jgi:hypothetical protein